ncbi:MULTISPECIES: FAD-binding oxidoreductase [unclassified Nodularia (in: cyanobacteria)]|uniref:NAD(P)/FAD-dependent oxidoreductase n=1 Tax=unclassified Nodularia (in: cyanobacteria) TaxID=2656917 RepID=UPI00187F4F44|nr:MULTISPECIES: FAD-binding oxidoreductase [unclassified Nodularia (in: cyanobacteria)]MBE9200357.1 FAD-binding oxidoreductase [Nodularia sp. LEGE 06071]MCC2695102.1 FAD-binding oxidoreductase [Nodularia sp. LEGE 04288]
MKNYDWIVVGAGITGAAIAYEMAQTGFTVLLLEQNGIPENATRYSYGGLAYWSGSTPLARQLCEEAIALYQNLDLELDAETEFRELDLLLTIAADTDSQAAAASYNHVAIPPRLLNIKEACELEPLLNPEAIAGALTVKHGHINPEKTTQGYIQAFLRAGGEMQIAQVIDLQTISSSNAGMKLTGVRTNIDTYHSNNVVICVGGFSRQLLKSAGIPMKLYFTHAEVIETPPVELNLRTLIMPANLQRFWLEAESTKVDELWQVPNEPVPPILDVGAVQFQDGSLRLGQVSRVLTDPFGKINAEDSEKWLRTNIQQVLPTLANLPGTWHHCLVAFSSDRLPLIGAIPGFEGVHIFSGFSNPLVIVPPLARRFANFLAGKEDEIITQLSPGRE